MGGGGWVPKNSWLHTQHEEEEGQLQAPAGMARQPCKAVLRIHDFWCGSRSGYADPCLWIMDPDPAIFFIDLQDANGNKN